MENLQRQEEQEEDDFNRRDKIFNIKKSGGKVSFKHETTHKPNSHQHLDAGSVHQIPPQCERLGGGKGGNFVPVLIHLWRQYKGCIIGEWIS